MSAEGATRGGPAGAAEKRQIILLLDGTWKDAEYDPRDTNIVRMREIISRTLARRSLPLEAGPGSGPPDDGESIVGHTRRDESGFKHLVYYLRGVGTGSGFDRFRGGGFGGGLDANVRRAYKFLSFHYAPGDEVYVFGFSRGAYTARSLIGYIAAAGLLQREHCTPEREQLAWSYYRTRPDDRSPGIWHALGEHVHGRDALRIDCLGVFDTVGALGVPLELFRRWNRERYQFHSVELPSITKVNLHAIAIDEHRAPFEAAVWRQHKFKRLDTITEQVWFAGAHSDVGGGYEDEDSRADPSPELDDIALDWMLRRVRAHYAQFPYDPEVWRAIDPSWALAQQHEPRKGLYRARPLARRSIANLPVPVGRFEVNSGRERHVVAAGEMVHISALERLGCEVSCDNGTVTYAPPSLLAVLSAIAGTYGIEMDSAIPETPIRVVDWSGEPFKPESPDDRKKVGETLQAARRRLEPTRIR